MRDPAGLRPHLLDVVASIEGGRLRLTWIHPDTASARDGVARAATDTLTHLQRLIEHCKEPNAGGYTPSDFPQMDFSAEELEALLGDLGEGVN